jgi:hypothetical protein
MKKFLLVIILVMVFLTIVEVGKTRAVFSVVRNLEKSRITISNDFSLVIPPQNESD